MVPPAQESVKGKRTVFKGPGRPHASSHPCLILHAVPIIGAPRRSVKAVGHDPSSLRVPQRLDLLESFTNGLNASDTETLSYNDRGSVQGLSPKEALIQTKSHMSQEINMQNIYRQKSTALP